MQVKESIERATYNTRPSDASEYGQLLDLAKEVLDILSSNARRCGATTKTRRVIDKAFDLILEASDLFDMNDDDEYDSQY